MTEVGQYKNLEIGVQDLHQDWLAHWRSSIADKNLRDQIERNPRVNGRIIDNILQANGFPVFSKSEVDRQTIDAYQALKNNKYEFFHLCGLTLMGQWLRKTIDPEALAVFLRVFDQKKLQFAIRANIDYQPFYHIEVEPDSLANFVEVAGMRCVAGWSSGLPSFERARIMLMLPAEYNVHDEINAIIEQKIALRTINLVTEWLNKAPAVN